MNDPHRGSVPPIPPPLPRPPSQRSGCVTALLIIIGIILLLPGVCVILLASTLGGHIRREEIQLIVTCGVAAVGGIALIVWAARRP